MPFGASAEAWAVASSTPGVAELLGVVRQQNENLAKQTEALEKLVVATAEAQNSIEYHSRQTTSAVEKTRDTTFTHEPHV